MSELYRDVLGYEHICGKEISRGGQGVVFRTQTPDLVLKLALRDREIIRDDSEKENERYRYIRLLPIPQELHITLPLAVLEGAAGYVMTLLDGMSSFEEVFNADAPEGYASGWLSEQLEQGAPQEFIDTLNQYIASGGRRRRLTAFFKCACTLAQLHGAGLVYCDISGNNLFISQNMDYSEVWLIDADNLDWAHERSKSVGFQTPGYGAPEVMAGKGNSYFSDCYSFAIALFWTLCGRHPFDGEAAYDEDGDFCEDLRNSGHLPWILDEDDDSNAIAPDILIGESIINEPLRRLLQQTFSAAGRSRPGKRPSMAEWAWTLGNEVDRTVRCPRCGMDHNGVEFDECPWCSARPARVQIRSFLSAEAAEPFWQYVHEFAADGCVRVPLRLLRGVRTQEVDEETFLLTGLGDGTIRLSGFHRDWQFFLEPAEKELYGDSLVPGKCRLRCEKDGTSIWIEVNCYEAE